MITTRGVVRKVWIATFEVKVTARVQILKHNLFSKSSELLNFGSRTSLDMVVHYHETVPRCVKRLECYLESQGHSSGSNPQ